MPQTVCRNSRQWFSFRKIVFFLISLDISTFIFILPFNCKELGYSSYFAAQNLEEKIEKRNNYRLEKSIEFLQSVRKSRKFSSKWKDERTGKQICVSILTAERWNSPGYLLQTFGKLLKEIRNSSLNFELNVVNAEIPPELNKDALRLERFGIADHHIAHNKNDFRTMRMGSINRYDKHRYDLIETLMICNDKKFDYALILEDDALAGDNFALVLEYLMQKLPEDGSLGYLKLYHPEKWQGFGFDTKLEIFCISVVMVLIISAVLMSIYWHTNITLKNNLEFLVLLTLIIGYIWPVMYTFSRQHILEIFKFSRYTHFITNAPSCCTSAVLYKASVLQELISYLETELVCSQQYPIDIAVADYFEKRGLKRLQVIPNMFYHIGYFSSVTGGAKNPKEFFHLFEPTF